MAKNKPFTGIGPNTSKVELEHSEPEPTSVATLPTPEKLETRELSDVPLPPVMQLSPLREAQKQTLWLALNHEFKNGAFQLTTVAYQVLQAKGIPYQVVDELLHVLERERKIVFTPALAGLLVEPYKEDKK